VKFLNPVLPHMRIMTEAGDVLAQFADGALETEDPAVIERLAGFDFITAEATAAPAAPKKRAAKKAAAPKSDD